jgi:hypothetical protein
MSEKPIELDQHRGMAAQKATDTRRLTAESKENQLALQVQRDELESQLMSPAANWREAAAKARYVIGLYAETLGVGDTKHRTLVNAVLADLKRLDDEDAPARPAP